MTLPIPTVTITVQDSGASAALTVPQANVQLKIGCAIGGTPNQPFATTLPTSLQAQLIGGPLVEAGGLVCQAGNVCLAISTPIATAGTATAVTATVPGGSTSTVTVTVDGTNGAWDTYYVWAKCTVGGTIGTAPGPSIQISLDAGRNWGSPISLGTATALYLGQGSLTNRVVGGTGVQLNFGAGTMVAGDFWKFSTVGPQWNDAGLSAAFAAFFASQYAIEGVGSVHVVGVAAAGDLSAVQTALTAGVAGFVYARAICELRDALAPTAWGGSGETEAAWMTAIEAVVSGETAQPRVCADGGWYNTPSPYANQAGGAPAYRRPLAWSHAVKRTQIALQRRAGRVLDGPYATIQVNPASDPGDGFIYHDERTTPGLNAARIASAYTVPKKGQGFFQCQEPLLSAPGSQFTELVIGNALDAACDIAYAEGVNLVSDDLTTNPNGTLATNDLNRIQGDIQTALNEGLPQMGLVSSVTATINPTWNVLATSTVPIAVNVTPKAYVNAVTETISLSTGV